MLEINPLDTRSKLHMRGHSEDVLMSFERLVYVQFTYCSGVLCIYLFVYMIARSSK